MISKAETAVCYITDINFLTQALAAAGRMRSFVSADAVSIYCIVINVEERALADIEKELKPLDIEILYLSEAAIVQFDKEEFRKNNISYAALGRFFIDALLPERIARTLYFDADTWPLEDPSALVYAAIPEGRFAAVNDMISYTWNEAGAWGEFVRGYLGKLNVDPARGYFNSGMFATSRRTLRKVCDEAFAFFRDNTAICHHHDQSALNAVVGDRRIHLSCRWNFQTPFRALNVESRIAPRLYHFTEYPKAWMGRTEPWASMYDRLSAENARWKGMAPCGKQAKVDELQKYNAEKRSARLKYATLLLPRQMNRRAKLMTAEAVAWM